MTAQVPPKKANPRCLQKLHQRTIAELRADAERIIMQQYELLLAREQRMIDE